MSHEAIVSLVAQPINERTAILAFREWFGLSRVTAEILACLFLRIDWIRPEIIAKTVGASAGSVSRYHLMIIRQAMETEAVDAEHGCYRLTDLGRSECRGAIWTLAEEFRRAGDTLRHAS